MSVETVSDAVSNCSSEKRCRATKFAALEQPRQTNEPKGKDLGQKRHSCSVQQRTCVLRCAPRSIRADAIHQIFGNAAFSCIVTNTTFDSLAETPSGTFLTVGSCNTRRMHTVACVVCVTQIAARDGAFLVPRWSLSADCSCFSVSDNSRCRGETGSRHVTHVEHSEQHEQVVPLAVCR